MEAHWQESGQGPGDLDDDDVCDDAGEHIAQHVDAGCSRNDTDCPVANLYTLAEELDTMDAEQGVEPAENPAAELLAFEAVLRGKGRKRGRRRAPGAAVSASALPLGLDEVGFFPSPASSADRGSVTQPAGSSRHEALLLVS